VKLSEERFPERIGVPHLELVDSLTKVVIDQLNDDWSVMCGLRGLFTVLSSLGSFQQPEH
jgi:hypothetical protein